MLREPHSVFCQRIDVGRFNFFLAVTPRFGIAQIVGQNVNDIGFLQFSFMLFLVLTSREQQK